MLLFTVTLPQSNSTTMAKRTQETNSSQAAEADFKGAPGLDDLIQQGARRIIQQAIEAELAAMLEQYSNVKTIDGRRAVVRNGYLPEREIVTAVGPVPVQVPKVRDRSGSGIKFNSSIVPPYVRKSPRVRRRCHGCTCAACPRATWAPVRTAWRAGQRAVGERCEPPEGFLVRRV
jgi:hypothetical protein